MFSALVSELGHCIQPNYSYYWTLVAFKKVFSKSE